MSLEAINAVHTPWTNRIDTRLSRRGARWFLGNTELLVVIVKLLHRRSPNAHRCGLTVQVAVELVRRDPVIDSLPTDAELISDRGLQETALQEMRD